MSNYLFEIGLLCFGFALIGAWLTIREMRSLEEQAKNREKPVGRHVSGEHI